MCFFQIYEENWGEGWRGGWGEGDEIRFIGLIGQVNVNVKFDDYDCLVDKIWIFFLIFQLLDIF